MRFRIVLSSAFFCARLRLCSVPECIGECGFVCVCVCVRAPLRVAAVASPRSSSHTRLTRLNTANAFVLIRPSVVRRVKLCR